MGGAESRSRTRAGAITAALALVLALPASAPADVYWANRAGNTIGTADLDGSNPNQSFITGATVPRAVAIDGTYVYWAQGDTTGTIGRAPLDGAQPPQQSFVVTGGSSPQGIAFESSRIYWTHTVAGAGKVGRANVDGSGVNPSFLPTGSAPCGIAVDSDKEYWANGGVPGSIGRAHGPFEANQSFLTGTQDPCGVALTDTHLFWTNRGSNRIGRATRIGGDVNQSFIATEAAPCGVAADGDHLYWTTANGKVWKGNRDGTGVPQSIVTGAGDPCGVAVDPTARPTPLASSFPATDVRAQSDIQTIFLTNTSSSVLAVSSATVVGAHPGDFAKTGDGCTLPPAPARHSGGAEEPRAPGGLAPGGNCVLNVRFDPTAAGARSAMLRVTSNASDSPKDIPLDGEGVAAAADDPGTGSPRGAAGGAQPASPPVASGMGAAVPVLPAAGLTGCKSRATVGPGGQVTLCSATNPPAAATWQTLIASLPGAAARRTVLGRGKTVIPAGQTKPVLARLGSRAMRALRARGRLAARLEVVVDGPGGESATVKRRLTLRLAKKVRRRGR